MTKYINNSRFLIKIPSTLHNSAPMVLSKKFLCNSAKFFLVRSFFIDECVIVLLKISRVGKYFKTLKRCFSSWCPSSSTCAAASSKSEGSTLRESIACPETAELSPRSKRSSTTEVRTRLTSKTIRDCASSTSCPLF